MFATTARSCNQGGLAFFWRDSDLFSVESAVCHGPNVMSCYLITGSTRTPLIGVYIPPADLTTLGYLDRALARFGDETNSPIVLGDINVNLAAPTGGRGNDIAAYFSTAGLEDMLPHFRQRSCHGHC